jgi:SOS-response transcriptional repressor LexA
MQETDTFGFPNQVISTEIVRDDFSRRLNQAFDDLGWKKSGRPAKLASLLQDKISQPAVRKWFNGEGLPSMPRLKELARLTGRSIEWLLQGDSESEAGSPTPEPIPVCMVPVIRAHFILDFANGAQLDESMIERWLPSPVKVSSRAFAFVHVGLSMQSGLELSYPDGTIVIIDPTIPAHPPCRVLVETEHGAAFKELVEDSGISFLRSLNTQYPNIAMGSQVKIHGVAVCRINIESQSSL